MAHFVALCDVIVNVSRFLMLIHKNLDILLYKIVKSEKIGGLYYRNPI